MAHSTLVAPEASWILRQLTDYHEQGVVPIFDLGGTNDPISDELLARSDAFVTEFSTPNDEQVRKVMLAHAMGKSVLAFLPPNSRLTHYLSGFPEDEFEGNKTNRYITKKPGSGSVTAYRGSMRDMKLKIWIYAEQKRKLLRNLAAENQSRVATEPQNEDGTTTDK